MDAMTLIHGDCLQEMKKLKDKSIDLVLTDPPYPDYHKEKYGYKEGLLDILNNFTCRQFVFWSSKVDFSLSYTAIHIWDKKTGCGSEYERIFERNGQQNYRMFRYYTINSTVAANYTRDTFYNHPSQKPVKLIKDMLQKFSKKGDTILDMFMGVGSIGVACKELNRDFIGIEINKEYYDIAKKRIANTQKSMF